MLETEALSSVDSVVVIRNAARVRNIRWNECSIQAESGLRAIHVASGSLLRAFAAYREERHSQTGLYPSPLLPNLSHLSWTLGAKTPYVPHLVSDKLESLELNPLPHENFPKSLSQEICRALVSLLRICKNLKWVGLDWERWVGGHDELIEQALAMPVFRFNLGDNRMPFGISPTQLLRLGSLPELWIAKFYLPAGSISGLSATTINSRSSQNLPVPCSKSMRAMFLSLQSLSVGSDRIDVFCHLLDTIGSTPLQYLKLTNAPLNRNSYLQLHQLCTKVAHFKTLQVIEIESIESIDDPIDVAIAGYPLEPLLSLHQLTQVYIHVDEPINVNDTFVDAITRA